MSRSRRPQPDELNMELTPMIDIVFNLLVFFMVATKFRAEQRQFTAFLPRNRGTGTGSSEVRLDEVRLKLLWVDAAGAETRSPEGFAVVKLGAQRLNAPGQAGPHDPVWSDLYGRLLALRLAYHGSNAQGLPVILDARPNVPTQVVISALNEIRRAEVEDLTFAAPESEY